MASGRRKHPLIKHVGDCRTVSRKRRGRYNKTRSDKQRENTRCWTSHDNVAYTHNGSDINGALLQARYVAGPQYTANPPKRYVDRGNYIKPFFIQK